MNKSTDKTSQISQSKGGLSISKHGKKGTKTMSKSKSKSDVAIPTGSTFNVPLGKLVVDDSFNARTQGLDDDSIKEFAETIKREGKGKKHEGLLQAVVVEPLDDGRFFLKAGFRRVKAVTLLGWDYIPSTVKVSEGDTDKEKKLSSYMTNFIENVARQNLTPFDMANRCLQLKQEFGLDGGEIAKRLNKSTGYINNLIAVVGGGTKGERKGATLHPDILRQWQEECSWPEDSKRTKVCTIDQMKRWLVLPHDEQMTAFNREMYRIANPKADMEAYDKALQGDGGGSGPGPTPPVADKVRATKAQLEAALEAVKDKLKSDKLPKEQVTRFNGIKEGLLFALGAKSGHTNRIADVIAYKDGTMVEGPAQHAAN